MAATPGQVMLTAVVAAAISISACSRSSSSPPVDQTKAAVPGTAANPANQPVNEDAKALAGFLERVNQYAALHQKLENSLPKLSKESTPQQIDAHQRALSKLKIGRASCRERV